MNTLDFFLSHPIAFQCFITFLGLMVGSFLNVVITRLPVLNPNFISFNARSQCPKCYHMIHAKDNIPLISFFILKGRCRHCQEKISWRYPFIELLTASLSFCVAAHFGASMQTVMALILTWALIILSFIDLDHMILPDDITLPMLWLGLILSIFSVFQNSTDSILGASLGYLSLWSIYWLFKLMTDKEGIGYGDFKLLAMLGAWLGWQMIPFIILISSLLGSVVGLYFIVIKKFNKNTPLPFGPYIALAGWLALLGQSNIMNFFYLNFILR